MRNMKMIKAKRGMRIGNSCMSHAQRYTYKSTLKASPPNPNNGVPASGPTNPHKMNLLGHTLQRHENLIAQSKCK